MKKAFTLIELLIVVGIMGLLGTISVGGYRAMQRGMADRGVMENVNSFVRSAYRRAQIDRQPTAVFFWNETVRASSDTENEIIVGKAIAIRRHGRISRKLGGVLIDEFADLNLTYQTSEEEDGDDDENSIYLYALHELSDNKVKRSTVSGKVYLENIKGVYLSGDDNGVLKDSESGVTIIEYEDRKIGDMSAYGFKIIDANGVDWKPGMAYGLEFARIELPHNYTFGDGGDGGSYTDPLKDAGIMVFKAGKNTGRGAEDGIAGSLRNISVYCRRPGPNGELKPEKVGQSEDPSKEMEK